MLFFYKNNTIIACSELQITKAVSLHQKGVEKMDQQEVKLDIPKIFYSDAEEKPFETCVVCGKELLHSNEPYMVEKVLKTYDGHDFTSTVFEFAICTHCHQKMQEGMSEESMQSMQQYYQHFVEQRGSDSIMIDLQTFDINEWMSKCFFKNTPVTELKEYQVVGMFKGDKLLLNQPPMVMGSEVMEEMAELLSKKTKDEMNGFREKFLGPPPEFSEFIYGKKLIVV